MNSTIVFDIIRTDWISKTNFLPGSIIMLLGCVMIVMNMRRKRIGLPAYGWGRYTRLSKEPDVAMPYVVLAFGLILTAAFAVQSYTDYTKLRFAYDSGQCEVVEGIVENFHAGQKMKNARTESFDIGQKHFAYPDSGNTAAFTTTEAYGGPVKNGLHVRIHQCGSDIARLEIINGLKPQN